MIDRVRGYVDAVARELKSGVATEHSYRPCLKALLEALLPGVVAVNEPSRIDCGAPDFLVRENGPARRPVGYVETKDVGDGDLDGNGVHKEQFDRYKAELSNIVFTDYLDFHFYEDGEFVAKCCVGEVEGSRIVPAAPEEMERFAGLLRHFAEVAPKRIASPSRLAYLMAGKARLLARAVAATLTGGTDDSPNQSPLAQQFMSFRQWLVHDLDVESFADVYAQTIVYGMFAARLHDTTPEDFSRTEAVSLVPRSNPLLRRLFRDLDEYVDDSIVWIIDDLVALFAASDVAAIMENYGESDRDPLLHFYEDFLAAYNPSLRKQRGVWYTPSPVVRFIVRSVDAILQRDFDLPAGLADASKTRVKVVNDDRVRKGDAKFIEREMHRVQILDPAAGTGTFLAETVRLIHSKFAGQEGVWPGYVREHLVPRLNGFEILMASYAMAHLKLDLLLMECANVKMLPITNSNTQLETGNIGTGNTGNIGNIQQGNTSTSPQSRLRVFLTNSLEEFSETTGTLWAMELSNESREADFIKRDCPVMVVIGNPPYSVSSSNKGEWIEKLIADYKENLGERNIQPLSDDYIKFIRLGQHYIDKNGEGILAFITNNTFLDGLIHRRMRQSLTESFDEIYVLNLHGNARKKETAPDGGKDENVFDIMQGVSINIFVKSGNVANVKMLPITNTNTQLGTGNIGTGNTGNIGNNSRCTVRYADLWGTREAKYAALDAATLESIEWQTIDLREPYFFFVPKDFALEEEYNNGFSVVDLMGVYSLGVQSGRDELFYDSSKAMLLQRMGGLFSRPLPTQLRERYKICDRSGFMLETHISEVEFNPSKISEIALRPFDIQYIYYDEKILKRAFHKVMSHMRNTNISLCIVKNSRNGVVGNYFVANKLVGKDYVSSLDNCHVFPLYLYIENMGQMERKANLNPKIVAKLCASASLREKPSPEDIFAYVYAVLHTPQYRERYREFLKIDFPRIPYPKDGEEFSRMAAIGKRLVAVHLLKDPKVRDMFSPYANFSVAGDNNVANVKMLPVANTNVANEELETGNTGTGNTGNIGNIQQGNIGNNSTCRIYINSTQYFDNVPLAAWEFFVGGYQPAQKWLKDRRGSVLSSDDIMHYKAVVSALVETRRLMDELEVTA